MGRNICVRRFPRALTNSMTPTSQSHSALASQSKALPLPNLNSFNSSRKHGTNHDEDTSQLIEEKTHCQEPFWNNTGCAGGSFTCVDCSVPSLDLPTGLNDVGVLCPENLVRSTVSISLPAWGFDRELDLPGRIQVPTVGH